MSDTTTATLQSLFESYLATGDSAALQHHLARESRLPGPRANLELARAFAETAGAMAAISAPHVWALVQRLTSLSATDAPTNSPDEFIPFCGAWAAGEVGAVVPALRESVLSLLYALAHDERWRLREAVANGIQALLCNDPADAILAALDAWIVPGDWLAMRAVVAGLADPDIVAAPARAEAALAIHRRVLTAMRLAGDRRSEAYRTLRQGLEYTLGVVVQALPKEGFAFLEELAEWRDQDVTRIVRENLKKACLRLRFPDQVTAVAGLLD